MNPMGIGHKPDIKISNHMRSCLFVSYFMIPSDMFFVFEIALLERAKDQHPACDFNR